MWHHALQFTAEVMLEGLARAGAKSRCTMMGRAAMSLDLQVSQPAVREVKMRSGIRTLYLTRAVLIAWVVCVTVNGLAPYLCGYLSNE